MHQNPSPFNGIPFNPNPQSYHPYPFLYQPYTFPQNPEFLLNNSKNTDGDKRKKEKNESKNHDAKEIKKEETKEEENGLESLKEQMTYVYKSENSEIETLFSKEKVSANGEKVYYKCLDRKCGGRLILDRKISKTDGVSKIILNNPVLSKKCTKKYEEHSWVEEKELMRKLSEKLIRKSELENQKTQEAYFKAKIQENPNQLNSDLLHKFRKEFPDIQFQLNSKSISLIKQNLKRINFDFKRNIELIDELTSSKGTKLLQEKITFTNEKGKKENVWVFAEEDGISILRDKNYSHFFIDGTFDCLPSQVDACQFIVCLGYNDTYDYFQPAFFALMQSKSEEAYTRLHQAIKNISNDRFKPIKFTLDFEKAHINAIKKIHPETKFFLCFFHFAQALWRRAGLIGLRQSDYIENTKDMILNLKLLCFLQPCDLKDYYKNISENFEKIDDLFKTFLDYFQNTWLSGGVFEISQWNYHTAISDDVGGNLSDKMHFTNNAVEGANNLINGLLGSGRISVSQFNDMLNTVVLMYDANKRSKERKMKTSLKRTKVSEVMIFLAKYAISKNKHKLLKGKQYKVILENFNYGIFFPKQEISESDIDTDAESMFNDYLGDWGDSEKKNN